MTAPERESCAKPKLRVDKTQLVCAYAEPFASTEFPDGFREVRFASECDCVESYMLAGAKLERVVLPADVKEVGQHAFAWNRGLCELVIEGDTSRIAGWAADAFEGCPCEEEYLELRRKAQAECSPVQG